MLLNEVFQIIDLINTDIDEIKEITVRSRGSKKPAMLESQLTSAVKDLHNINGELSKLANSADEKFLNTYKVGSYRKRGTLSSTELKLANISNYLHSLDVNFEDFLRAVESTTDISEQEILLLYRVNKNISQLINGFNSTEIEYLKSKDVEYSEFKNKIITESMNIIVKELDSQFSDNKQQTDKMVQRFQTKINEVEIATENNLNVLHNKANTIEELYETTLAALEEKKEQMDEVLGQTANRVMAQDYEHSAEDEKKAANWLRLGSLFCMAIIVGIVCSSFYDSTHSGFDWESSIFRTVLVFILSIPAAYLSRESTKHREQQYNYHHTALDLKAITPYIASLPETDQNRIKISIAERIFASRQTNAAQQDSFPLNTQELVMELIKKVDIKKEDKKDTHVENAGK